MSRNGFSDIEELDTITLFTVPIARFLFYSFIVRLFTFYSLIFLLSHLDLWISNRENNNNNNNKAANGWIHVFEDQELEIISV